MSALASPPPVTTPDRPQSFTPEQLRALASPARQEILQAVQSHGPCSISELAEHLGRPADSLYYHVRHLNRVELLREQGVRKAKRREEVLFDTPRFLSAGGLTSLINGDPAGPEAVVKSTAAMLRITERNLRNTFQCGLAISSGKDRNVAAGRYKGWATSGEVEEILEHIEKIRAILSRNHEPGEDRQLVAASLVFAPVAPPRKNRKTPA